MGREHNYTEQNTNHSESNILEKLRSEIANSFDLEEKTNVVLKFWKENRGRYNQVVEEYLPQIIKEAEEVSNYYALGWCHFISAWQIIDHDQLLQEGKKDQAIAFFVKAQEEFRFSGEMVARIRAFNGEASAYGQYGNFDKALEKYLYALELAEEIKDILLVSVIAHNIGVLLIDLKQYEEAIEYFKMSDIKSLDSYDEMSIQYSNMAEAYRLTGDLHTAEEKIMEALNLCKNDGIAAANSLLMLGYIKQDQGQQDLARQNFEKCLGLTSQKKLHRIRALCLLQLALIERSAGNLNMAFELVEEALTLSQGINTRKIELKVLEAKAEIYNDLGYYSNAYDTLKLSKKLEDNLFNEEIANKMGVMKVQQARRENLIFKELHNRINTISQIGQAITSILDIKEMGDTLYRHVKELMEVDNLLIGFYIANEKEINYKICINKGEYIPGFFSKLNKKDSLEARCISTKEGLLINNLTQEDNKCMTEGYKSPIGKEVNSLICCPLIIREKILGVIVVQSEKKNAYFNHDVDILKALATYVAIAMENGNLFFHINELATVDYLTGLSNRRSIFEQAEKYFITHKRYGQPLSVVIADIDRFKLVNDTYGHAVGDGVLQQVSENFLTTLRDVDTVGRIGGEEFLIVLPNTDIEQAVVLA